MDGLGLLIHLLLKVNMNKQLVLMPLPRLFPGTHLPNLFLGMQHLQMNNLNLLEEYLLASYHICNSDPLLLNELGVINFHKINLIKQIFLQEALNVLLSTKNIVTINNKIRDRHIVGNSSIDQYFC